MAFWKIQNYKDKENKDSRDFEGIKMQIMGCCRSETIHYNTLMANA